jgi:hypothetical protein
MWPFPVSLLLPNKLWIYIGLVLATLGLSVYLYQAGVSTGKASAKAAQIEAQEKHNKKTRARYAKIDNVAPTTYSGAFEWLPKYTTGN